MAVNLGRRHHTRNFVTVADVVLQFMHVGDGTKKFTRAFQTDMEFILTLPLLLLFVTVLFYLTNRTARDVLTTWSATRAEQSRSRAQILICSS